MHIWKHFSTITRHRHKVIVHCFMAGIFWQGLRHDLSKCQLESSNRFTSFIIAADVTRIFT